MDIKNKTVAPDETGAPLNSSRPAWTRIPWAIHPGKSIMKKGFLIPAALLALLSTLNSQLSTLRAQGTAFTYQGLLTENGTPVTGIYEFRFRLYATETDLTAVTTGRRYFFRSSSK